MARKQKKAKARKGSRQRPYAKSLKQAFGRFQLNIDNHVTQCHRGVRFQISFRTTNISGLVFKELLVQKGMRHILVRYMMDLRKFNKRRYDYAVRVDPQLLTIMYRPSSSNRNCANRRPMPQTPPVASATNQPDTTSDVKPPMPPPITPTAATSGAQSQVKIELIQID